MRPFINSTSSKSSQASSVVVYGGISRALITDLPLGVL